MTINTSKNLLIDDKAINYAKIYSSLLKEEFQRKRAYASLISLYALIGLLETTGYNIQKSMTIFRNPELNEEFEISDFYINNWHIDVRIITEGETFFVPKSHFDYSIEPDFYAVVKIDKELKNAEILGFADTKNMKKEALDYHYYSVNNNNLIDYDKFVDLVRDEKNISFSEEEHEFFRESYLSLVDKEIDKDTKVRVLKHLFKCHECRTEFCCFTGFEMVNCNLGNYPEILNDQTLNIVGAQDADSKKYEGKEETIYIGDDEEFEEYPEDENTQDNETVSDILDELFNVEEETIEIPVNENENLEYIDDSNLTAGNDEKIQMIGNNGSEINADDDLKEFKNIDNLEIESNEELLILNDEEDEGLLEETGDDTEGTKEEDIDKVIIDYDENGEPIYSYITNVNAEDFSDNMPDVIEPIVDDIQITEEYPTESIEENYGETAENIVENASEEVKNASEEVENVIADDEILDYPSEETTDNDIENQPSFEEENNDVQNIDDDTINSDSEISYKDDADAYADEYQEETSEDKTQEYETSEDTMEEYETEETDEDIGGPEVKAKSSTKTGLLVALALVVLAVPAAIIGTKYIKSATTDNVVTQVPDSDVTNDMFEQLESNPTSDDLIPPENNADNSIEIPQNESNIIADTQTSQEKTVADLTEKDLITNKPSGDVNKVMADAFSQSTRPVSITGVNWMCAPALFTDKTFKNYMQDIDKVLKLNLNKNILDATQTPVNKTVAVKFAVDNDGNLLKSVIASSSGSDEIDNIVLQSIKQTLETQKTTILADSDQKADKYLLKVVIKL